MHNRYSLVIQLHPYAGACVMLALNLLSAAAAVSVAASANHHFYHKNKNYLI